jgi:transposase-like protein
MTTRPEIFKCAVRWYLRYSLPLRDAEALLIERGLGADHTSVWRWVQRHAPELEQRLRHHLKLTNKSWRVDETYIRIKGRWCYLYRAIDSLGDTIDFLLSALRDTDAAKRLFRSALKILPFAATRHQYGLGTDLQFRHPRAKEDGTLRCRCGHRPVQYLNKSLG